MPPRNGYLLPIILLILILPACTIQGLPYPTETPDPNLITPDLEATRAMVESGMFPSSTPKPTRDTSNLRPTVKPDSISIYMPSLKVAYLKDGDVWYWELGNAPTQLTSSGDVVDVVLSDDWSQAAFIRQIDETRQAVWVVNTDGSWLQGLYAETDFDLLTSKTSSPPSPFNWIGSPVKIQSR